MNYENTTNHYDQQRNQHIKPKTLVLEHTEA